MPSRARLILAALLLVGSAVGPATAWADNLALSKPVRIESGLVQGVAEPGLGAVAFKGIAYAAPPMGTLRWREPQPGTAGWEGVREADASG